MDSCTGHMNFNTFQNCGVGMRVMNESRVNGEKNQYLNYIIATEAQNGGTLSINGSVFERNTMNLRVLSGGRITGQIIQGKNNAFNTVQEISTIEKINRKYTHTYRNFFEQDFNFEYFKMCNSSSNLGRVIDFTLQGSVSSNNSNKRAGAIIRNDSAHKNIELSFSSNKQVRFKVTGKIVFHRDSTQTLMLKGGVHGSS